ncbi:MAG: hypothetical protein O3A92_16870, partial [Verrucomicrobia bacterium]|nr:hypothetical protein [Verrucomicrobiota bacterium]
MKRYSIVLASVALLLVLLSDLWTNRAIDTSKDARQHQEQHSPPELPAPPATAPASPTPETPTPTP